MKNKIPKGLIEVFDNGDIIINLSDSTLMIDKNSYFRLGKCQREFHKEAK